MTTAGNAELVMRFRKKPVVIEAFQVTRRNTGPIPFPEWFEQAVANNDIITHGMGKFGIGEVYCEIKTLEGGQKHMSETAHTPDDGGPAFSYGDHINGGHTGMSLRDWFAGQFLAGAATTSGEPLDIDIAADQFDVDCAMRKYWGVTARAAYIAADAMLAARSKAEGSQP